MCLARQVVINHIFVTPVFEKEVSVIWGAKQVVAEIGHVVCRLSKSVSLSRDAKKGRLMAALA